MTPQAVIKKFMATLINHDYGTAADFTANILDDAIKSASNFDGIQDVIDAMKADQVAAEREAVEEILGSEYAGMTMSEISTSILSADAKNYDGTKISHAYFNERNDERTTVENAIKERKAFIFLEKYCGIQLEKKFWFTTAGSDDITSWTGDVTDNVDTGAITGSDANITLKAGNSIYGATLTAANLAELAQLYGDAAKLSDDGNTIVIGTGTEKTAQSVVPEAFINTYTARPEFAQVIDTGTRNWVVEASFADDTINSGGADSINAGVGNDVINVNGNGATVTSDYGLDRINISATVRNVTINDLDAQDVMTISGTFEVGAARIEDMLLVVTDSTGTRKIRFGDFTNATGATVNIGNTSTTLGDWLTNAGIDINNLERTTYAESVGVEVPSTQSSADDTVSEMYDTSNDSPRAVNLATVDTSQAGNVVVNGKDVGTLSSTYPNAPTFTRNGLTIHLLGSVSNTDGDPTDSNDNSLITPLTLDQLTDDQRTIIAGLFKWWGNESLKLAEDSYGIGFNSATAMVKDIGLYFYDGQGYGNTLAAVWNWQKLYTDGTGDGSTTQLMLNVNMHYFSGLDADDMDGTANNQSAGMLDRTLAHEFTHAVMGTNIRYFQKLPKFIKEGTAELTHGIDDERGNTIFQIAANDDWLDASLVLDNTGTGSQTVGDGYSGGYMFLRYFARRAALQTLFDGDTTEPESNPLLIVGTEGADELSNDLDGATIQALDGNDYIDNLGASALIDGGADDDTIDNYGSNVTIDGGTDNDVITNAFVVQIDNEGNITGFLSNTDNALIDGGDGNDTITNYGAMATIDGGADDDVINNSGVLVADENGEIITTSPVSSEVSINGGTGNDSIRNENDMATIEGGDGIDTIHNYGASVLIDGGDGDDSIDSRSASVTINGGEGNDTIANLSYANFYVGNEGNHVTISGGAGDDKITNMFAHVSIDAGDGDDKVFFSNYSKNVTIDGGAGNDSIEGKAVNAYITGGTGNDSVNQNSSWYNDRYVFTYAPGDGDDFVTKYAVINLVNGATVDTISASGNDAVVKIGRGSITVKDAAPADVIIVYNNNYGDYMVDLAENDASGQIVGNKNTARQQDITNYGERSTVLGGAGNDSIWNYGESSSLDGGDGNNDIYNFAANVFISGGASSDFIQNSKYGTFNGDGSTIDAGDGNDDIHNCAANVSINAGNGNDLIVQYGFGHFTTLDGGAGNDTIINQTGTMINSETNENETVTPHDISISGGEGDDSIRNDGDNITISGGLGDDTITNSGANVLFTYNSGDDSDTISGFNATSTLQIADGTGTYSTVANGDDWLVNVGDGSILLKGAATLATVNIAGVYKNPLSIVGTAGADTINNTLDGATIQALGGDDTILNFGASVLIDGGDGDDSITHGDDDYCGGDNVTILGGAGSDTIDNEGNKALLDGGTGNDLIFNVGDKVTIRGGTGDDEVYSTSSTVTTGVNVIIDGGEGNDYLYSHGNNVTISGGAGADTITNGGDQEISFNVTIDGGAGNDSIRNDMWGIGSMLDGGAGNDSIGNNGLNSTLNGGAGNDSIFNGANEVLFVYNSGDGNDSISGFNKTSTLSIGGGTYTTITNGDDLIFTVGDGSITLQGAATLSTVNIIGTEEIVTLLTVTDTTPSPVTIDSAVMVVDASSRTKAVKIVGNALANSIVGGSGADSIYGAAGNDILFGGKGNDTLVGGKGNDSLWGDAGKDTFIYTNGDGKDVIYGFQSGDLLQITGAFSAPTYNSSAKSIAFKVGSGSVTLRDFGSTTTFHVNDTTYRLSGGKLRAR